MAELKDRQAVLDHIKAVYRQWMDFGWAEPKLHPASKIGGPPKSFVILWEEGPEDWALNITEGLNARDSAVFCEPVNSMIVGIYDR